MYKKIYEIKTTEGKKIVRTHLIEDVYFNSGLKGDIIYIKKISII